MFASEACGRPPHAGCRWSRKKLSQRGNFSAFLAVMTQAAVRTEGDFCRGVAVSMMTVSLGVGQWAGRTRFYGEVASGDPSAAKTAHFRRKSETRSGQQIRQERDRRAQSRAYLGVTNIAHAG